MKERFILGVEIGINLCLLFLLTILPFRHTAGLQSIAYLTATFLWIIRCILKRKFDFAKTSLTIPFFGFGLMALFSTITSLNFKYSLHELRGEYGTYLLIFFLAVNNIKSIKFVRWMALSIFVTSFIISGYGILEYFLKAARGEDHWYISSLTADINYLSATLILVFPYAASFWFQNVFSNRWAKMGLCVLNLSILGCFMLVRSRGGYVALLTEVALLIFFIRKKELWQKFLILFLLLCLMGGILLFVYPVALKQAIFRFKERSMSLYNVTLGKFDISSLERLNACKFGSELIADYPITGIGYGKSSLQKSFSEEPIVAKIKHLHNIFLETAIEIGLPGLVFFVWLILALGLTLKEGYCNSQDPFHKAFFLASLLALIGYMVRNQFDHLYVDNLVRLFWLLMGIAVGLKVNKTS